MKTNKTYLIVGNGKLAKHLRFFLQSQNIRVQTWARKTHTPQQLQDLYKTLDYTLICISDSALPTFITENSLALEKCIHFSGALHVPGALSYHPLMTFSDNLYPLDFYTTIPLVGIKGQPQVINVLPFSNNPYYEIEADQKGLYHALCVLGGNFTNLLWSKVFKEFESLHIPAQALYPYMDQILENVKLNAQKSLTGPLARRDIGTIQAHLDKLKEDPYFDVYKSFVKAYDPTLFQELNI